jgi:hypothetical protein
LFRCNRLLLRRSYRRRRQQRKGQPGGPRKSFYRIFTFTFQNHEHPRRMNN